MRETIERYKRIIEEYLAEIDVYKGESYREHNKFDNYENRRFLKSVIDENETGETDEDAVFTAIEELIHYLYER